MQVIEKYFQAFSSWSIYNIIMNTNGFLDVTGKFTSSFLTYLGMQRVDASTPDSFLWEYLN